MAEGDGNYAEAAEGKVVMRLRDWCKKYGLPFYPMTMWNFSTNAQVETGTVLGRMIVFNGAEFAQSIIENFDSADNFLGLQWRDEHGNFNDFDSASDIISRFVISAIYEGFKK